MIAKKIIFFYILFSLTFFKSLYASINNKILIKVEDKIVTNYELKNKILTTLFLAGEEINQENINRLKRAAADSLITNKLKLIELDKTNISINKTKLNSYLNSISSNNITQLQKDFEKNNLDFELFKLEAEIQLKWQEFIFKQYSKKINMNESIINNEIENYLKDKKIIKEYNISEIEINLNSSNEDKNIIQIIKEEISKSGFENAALKYSISSSSKNKGSLGWIKENSLSREIQQILSKMKLGDVSEPIKRTDSILLLKLNDIKNTDQENLNMEKLRKELVNQKKNELFNLYSKSHISKLKNTSFIEYK